MKLTEQQKKVLEMPFDTFLSRYMDNSRYFGKLYVTAGWLTHTNPNKGFDLLMRDLVAFSKREWMTEGREIGEKCITALSEAFERAGISFCMDLSEEDAEDNNAEALDESQISIFETLQEQFVRLGGDKAELEIKRPDGFTWIFTVLPPGNEE